MNFAFSEEQEQLREFVRSLGQEDAVQFTGFVSTERLRALYACCSAAVSPSLAEGGNMIAQEAVAFGKPVAGADTEPTRDQAALMGAELRCFSADDVDSMAAVLADLVKEGEQLVAENTEARERVQSWTWERTADRLMRVFRWVAEGCKPEERPAFGVA